MKANLNDVERQQLRDELSGLINANNDAEQALARRGVTIKPEGVMQLRVDALVALLCDNDDKELQFTLQYQRQAALMLAAVAEHAAKPKLHMPGSNGN